MSARAPSACAAPARIASLGACATLTLALLAGPAPAQDTAGGVLAECAALSPLIDDVHACLDDYLGRMDESIASVESLIERRLDDEAERAAFDASRRAFSVYRRENCLWYLSFSTPRVEAEQIAKDCLASMSLHRLSELRRLLGADDGRDAVLSGYYVYDDARNTFRPCGSDARYWVTGDAAAVEELQQLYLDVATSERQLLYARLRGAVDTAVGETVPSGHDGVLRARVIGELRVPREGDCRLAAGVPGDVAAAPPVAVPAEPPEPPAGANGAGAPASASREADDTSGQSSGEEPDERLTAYFGDWTADCTALRATRECTLSTALLDGDGPAGEADESTLALVRRPAERTRVELRFPEREIDSPAKIRWRVDEDTLGDIVGSSIRVDATGTRQLVEEPRYLRQELLPMLIDGATLDVEVLGSVDDPRGERFSATLMGLTRALAFADEFAREGEGL